MKKNSKQLIILLAVLFVCIAGYITVVLINQYQDQKAAEEEASNVIYIGEIAEASEISFNNGTETLSFYKEDSTWYYEDDSDFPLTQSYLTNIADTVIALAAVREIEIIESLDAYGLENPAYTISVTDTSGNTLDLLVGGVIGDNYYAMIPDDDVIYTIDPTLVGYLSYGLYDMLELEAFDSLDESNLEAITITMGEMTLSLEKETILTEEETETSDSSIDTAVEPEATAEYSWFVTNNAERTAIEEIDIQEQSAADYLDSVLEAVSSLNFESCSDYKADSEVLSACGLDSPYLILTVTYTGADEEGNETAKTFTLNIGSMTEDQSGYYAKLSDSTAVNTLSVDLITPLVEAASALGV